MKINKLTLSILALSFLTLSCSNDDNNSTSINLQDLEVTIDENPTNGLVLGTVQSNSASPLTFSIVSQTPAGALEIDATTGELTVLDAGLFDFETNSTITATVSVSGASNNATVTIDLLDKPEVGEYKFGGVIFWVNSNGNEGLACAVTDQSAGIRWYNGSNGNTGATGAAIGTGASNTTSIVNFHGTGSYAAQLCNDLSLNGYNDWFLPSVDELQEIYNNKTVINTTSIANSGLAIEEGFESYWSSTQVTNATANAVRFSDGIIGEEYKSVNYINVRAVRHWTDF